MGSSRVDWFRSGLVAIVRDFMLAHELLSRLSDRFEAGKLRFDDVQGLIGDTDHAVLFRLKERCHVLFRSESLDSRVRIGELFDLAVGSLFHEAMKFRENVYQLEVYAPRVQRLRKESAGEADDLLLEFEKVLASSPDRLAETLHETEVLFAQTRRQLHRLLAAHADNGLVARFLLERANRVGDAFPGGLEQLLTELYGGSAEACVIAVHSYLESAHFDEALRMIEEVGRQATLSQELVRLGNYARAMQTFIAGEYSQSLRWLSDWLDGSPAPSEAPYARMALSAISRVGRLLDDDEDSSSIEATAAALSLRLEVIADLPVQSV